MRIIPKVYNLLVNRIPGIRDRYHHYRDHVQGIRRGAAWFYLLHLNIQYYVFRKRDIEVLDKYPFYEEKQLLEGSESALSCKISPEQFAKQLDSFDVISFDVFDTLVLRPFSRPSDLFFLVGNTLDYPDFKEIRREMEQQARKRKFLKKQHYEVTLDEIYMLLSEETGIEKNSAMEQELALEYQFCYANPFMKRVIDILLQQGKRLIVTSDMYLNTVQIRTLLERCGYPAFAAYYVSCDLERSKSNGDSYDYIKEKEGRGKLFAHVGDNEKADVQQAQKHGFTAFHYKNVNQAGALYRPDDMSAITGSLYRGIVNAHIHNGLCVYTKEYEYGYIYGGLFVVGYCQFIHEYVKQHKIEKILFLARDGDVLSKAYQILYPEESEKQEYVYWSRLAATKMTADHFKYDYFRRFLFHKVNQQYTLQNIFATMELEDMLKDLYSETGFNENTKLNDHNVGKVKDYLLRNWNQVIEHYEEQITAGGQYYSEKLQGSRTAVAVDIGWAGSGAITLNYLVNNIWNLDCKVTGLIAGTNSCHNTEPDTSETFLQSGKLVSYLYSQRENRDLWKLHDPAQKHNLYWELLLDAPMGSLKGFYLDEQGKYECKFKKENVKQITEIQKGIIDFVNQFHKIQNSLGPLAKISGRDAYAPMINAENRKNKDFFKNLLCLFDEENIH